MTEVQTILQVRSNASLEAEVEKELKIQDPKKEKGEAKINDNIQTP